MRKSRWFVASALAVLTLLPSCFADYEKVGDASQAGSEGQGVAGSVSQAGVATRGGAPNASGGAQSPMSSLAGAAGGDPSSGQSSLAGAAGSSPSDAKAGAAGANGMGCSAISPICSVGEVDTETKPCGSCGKGTTKRTRECGSDCAWKAWSDWSACNEVVECKPGETRTQNVSCPCASDASLSQKRTCSDACTWGSWQDTSVCQCCSQLVYCDTPDSVATNRGTWCRPESSACSKAQVEAGCMSILDDLGCQMHQPYYYGQ